MRDLDINIRTIDRGLINYIDDTIKSLAKSEEFKDYEINVLDSGSKSLRYLDFLDKYKNVRVEGTKERLSAMENYIRALKTEKEWVLVLGDDFMFSNNFFRELERVRGKITEEMRLVSLFLNYEEGLEEDLFYKIPAHKFWGGNVLLRREDAWSLAEYMQKEVDINSAEKYMDIYMKYWHIEKYRSCPIYLVALGLCQHIGERSTLGYKEKREGFTRQGFPNYD